MEMKKVEWMVLKMEWQQVDSKGTCLDERKVERTVSFLAAK